MLQDRGRQIVVLRGVWEKEKGASRKESEKSTRIKVHWSCRYADRDQERQCPPCALTVRRKKHKYVS